jgi:hypothetical protein
MERVDRYGEGTLRARSRSIGLLYYRGEVVPGLVEVRWRSPA